jgi:hypothetical protein
MQRRISLRLAPEFSGAETSIELDVSGGLGAFSPFIQFLKKAEQRGTHLETLVLSLGWFCERSHRDRSGQVPPRAPGPGAQTSRELTIALALASGLAIVRAGAIAGIAYVLHYPRLPYVFAVTSAKHFGFHDILRILYSCNPDAFIITLTQALFFSACLFAPEVILCIRAMAAKRRAHRFVSGSGLSDSTPAGRHCGEES